MSVHVTFPAEYQHDAPCRTEAGRDARDTELPPDDVDALLAIACTPHRTAPCPACAGSGHVDFEVDVRYEWGVEREYYGGACEICGGTGSRPCDTSGCCAPGIYEAADGNDAVRCAACAAEEAGPTGASAARCHELLPPIGGLGVAHAAVVGAELRHLFARAESEDAWWHAPWPAFDGLTPAEALATRRHEALDVMLAATAGRLECAVADR